MHKGLAQRHRMDEGVAADGEVGRGDEAGARERRRQLTEAVPVQPQALQVLQSACVSYIISYVNIYIYIYECIHIIYIDTDIDIDIYIHTHTHKHKHTHRHTHTDRQTHTHTHTQTTTHTQGGRQRERPMAAGRVRSRLSDRSSVSSSGVPRSRPDGGGPRLDVRLARRGA